MQSEFSEKLIVVQRENIRVIIPSLFFHMQYDCSRCGGVCCNINGSLVFEEKEFSKINKDDIFRGFYMKENNFCYLKTPKKCWFLSGTECSLESLKPVYCSFFPYKLINLTGNLYVVSLDICSELLHYEQSEDVAHRLMNDAYRMIELNHFKRLNHESDEDEILSKMNLLFLEMGELFRKYDKYSFMNELIVCKTLLSHSIFLELSKENVIEIFSLYEKVKKDVMSLKLVEETSIMNSSLMLQVKLMQELKRFQDAKKENI